jgi:outer membrane protein assembly factor BamA
VFASIVVGVGGSARAQVAPDPAAPATDEAPVPPSSTAPPTGQFYAGGAYRSDDGFTFRSGISQSNLFHTGNALSLDASISERARRFSIKFVDPHIMDDRFTLSAEVYADHRMLGAYDVARDAVGAEVDLSTRLADHARAFIGYRYETVDNTGLLAWVRAGADYSTLDSQVAPTRGTSMGMTVGVANDAFGSQYDLTRVDAWINTHQGFGPFIVHAGARVAGVASNSDGGSVPFTEMLFFGGPSDIRGFGYDGFSYSPGDLLGTWRTELELPIAGGVSARGFWDGATMFDWHANGELAQSVGAGILWRSPLGPISVDYALPFNGTGPRWLFAVGQTF